MLAVATTSASAQEALTGSVDNIVVNYSGGPSQPTANVAVSYHADTSGPAAQVRMQLEIFHVYANGYRYPYSGSASVNTVQTDVRFPGLLSYKGTLYAGPHEFKATLSAEPTATTPSRVLDTMEQAKDSRDTLPLPN